MTVDELRFEVEALTDRGAWGRGVTAYAIELLDELEEARRAGYAAEALDNTALLEKAMLNGEEDWTRYSWGGCSLIYDKDIARRLCSPSELKRTRDGERRPNGREEWLDCQARALFQACNRIKKAWGRVTAAEV